MYDLFFLDIILCSPHHHDWVIPLSIWTCEGIQAFWKKHGKGNLGGRGLLTAVHESSGGLFYLHIRDLFGCLGRTDGH